MTKTAVNFSLSAIMAMLAMFSFGCYQAPVNQDAANLVKETREMKNFTGLEIGGAFTVYLQQGQKEAVTVEANQEDIAEVVTEVTGKALKIYMKQGWRGKNRPVKIYIDFLQLESMDLSGAVEVESRNRLNFEGLALEVSGAAEISMAFEAARLDATFSGASDVEFSGTVDQGRIEISGAAEFDAEGLTFRNLDAEISGAGNARLNVTGELNIDASGASSVRHKGGATVKSNTSGASSVKPM